MERASVPNAGVEAGDQLDKCLVQLPADRADHSIAKTLSRASKHIRFPGIKGRLQGTGEPAHSMDVSEKLLVWHGGVVRHYSCRLKTPIKLSILLA